MVVISGCAIAMAVLALGQLAASTSAPRLLRVDLRDTARGSVLGDQLGSAAAVGRCAALVMRRSPDLVRDRIVGRCLITAAPCVLLVPWLALIVIVTTPFWVVRARRRMTRQRETALLAGVGELVDLFAVALLNGHNVANAVRQVHRWAEGEYRDTLSWCCHQVEQGRSIADALEEVPDRSGAAVRPLVSALIANERYGSPISQTLTQLAVDARNDDRRRAETAARRLPIVLLFPLVLCVLPAFLLLTIVPVVVDALTTFGTS